MQNKPLIRRAQKKDIEAIVRLTNQSGSPWSFLQVAEEFDHDFSVMLVSETDGIADGFADLHLSADSAHINNFVVEQGARKKRRGSALLSYLIDTAKTSGCRSVTLEMREGNAAASALYRSHAFLPVGKRRGFYRDPAEDAIVMRKEIESENKPVRILGIETSCDETAAAVVEDGREIISNIVYSQIKEHSRYGGVVPEIASRRHVEEISRVVRAALDEAALAPQELDAVAVTYAPGLIGALLVGLGFAKGFAYAENKPLVPVHHLHGHVASLYLSHPSLEPPFVALIASGGHSHIARVDDYDRFTVLGRAVDDAAGEAFDKVARTLGLGYPGGPAIERAAKDGSPAIKLPSPQTEHPLDMSFSGLKTAVINLLHRAEQVKEPICTADVAASFQQRVVEMLAARLVEAAKKNALPVGVCGGVAANGMLRNKVEELAAEAGIRVFLSDRSLTGDNAAMIASAGYYGYLAGKRAPLSQNAFSVMDMTAAEQ